MDSFEDLLLVRRSGNFKRRSRMHRRQVNALDTSTTSASTAQITALSTTPLPTTTGPTTTLLPTAITGSSNAAAATGQAALFSLSFSQDTTTVNVIDITITRTHYNTISTNTSIISTSATPSILIASSSTSVAANAASTSSSLAEVSGDSSTSASYVSPSSKKIPTVLVAVLCSLIFLALLTASALYCMRRRKERRRDSTLAAVAAAAAAVEKDIAGDGDFGRPDSPYGLKGAAAPPYQVNEKYVWGPLGTVQYRDKDEKTSARSTYNAAHGRDGAWNTLINKKSRSPPTISRPQLQEPQPQTPSPRQQRSRQQPQLQSQRQHQQQQQQRSKLTPPQMQQISPSGPHPSYSAPRPPPPFPLPQRSSPHSTHQISGGSAATKVPSPLGRGDTSQQHNSSTSSSPVTYKAFPNSSNSNKGGSSVAGSYKSSRSPDSPRFYAPGVQHLIEQVGDNKQQLAVAIDRAREIARGNGSVRQYRSDSTFVV